MRTRPPLPVTRTTWLSRSSASNGRLASSERRSPQSNSKRRMARLRRSSNSVPAHCLNSRNTSSSVSIGGGASVGLGALMRSIGLEGISPSSTAHLKKARAPRWRVRVVSLADRSPTAIIHSSRCSRVMLATTSGMPLDSRNVASWATEMVYTRIVPGLYFSAFRWRSKERESAPMSPLATEVRTGLGVCIAVLTSAEMPQRYHVHERCGKFLFRPEQGYPCLRELRMRDYGCEPRTWYLTSTPLGTLRQQESNLN